MPYIIIDQHTERIIWRGGLKPRLKIRTGWRLIKLTRAEYWPIRDSGQNERKG